MFEKFFGPKSEGQKEMSLFDVASREFDLGINGPAVFRAFRAAKEENEKNNYGFTNNRVLNIVKKCATDLISAHEEILMGGREGVIENINREIESLRQKLSEEEQRS